MQKKCQEVSSKPDRGLRVREVAEMLGVSVSTVWTWTRQGRLRKRKLGKLTTIWLQSELQKFLAEGGVSA